MAGKPRRRRPTRGEEDERGAMVCILVSGYSLQENSTSAGRVTCRRHVCTPYGSTMYSVSESGMRMVLGSTGMNITYYLYLGL